MMQNDRACNVEIYLSRSGQKFDENFFYRNFSVAEIDGGYMQAGSKLLFVSSRAQLLRIVLISYIMFVHVHILTRILTLFTSDIVHLQCEW